MQGTRHIRQPRGGAADVGREQAALVVAVGNVAACQRAAQHHCRADGLVGHQGGMRRAGKRHARRQRQPRQYTGCTPMQDRSALRRLQAAWQRPWGVLQKLVHGLFPVGSRSGKTGAGSATSVKTSALPDLSNAVLAEKRPCGAATRQAQFSPGSASCPLAARQAPSETRSGRHRSSRCRGGPCSRKSWRTPRFCRSTQWA